MTQEKASQKKMVLAHLQQHGKLTPLDALALYGCYRLSSVIFRLRNDGHDIKTVNIVTGKQIGRAHV